MSNAIECEKQGSIALIALNRPEAMNAMDNAMLLALSEAYTAYEDDPQLRCAVLYAKGRHFTVGLELGSVVEEFRQSGKFPVPPNGVDPWGVSGRRRSKPVIAAAHGFCFTLGIELLLAADIRIAASSSRFAQAEAARGLMPLTGATWRYVREAGWGEAMRYLLTADPFGASVARNLGIIQEIVPQEDLLATAMGMAQRVAANAPLAVRGIIRSARAYADHGEQHASDLLLQQALSLLDTQDLREGIRALEQKRKPQFEGR